MTQARGHRVVWVIGVAAVLVAPTLVEAAPNFEFRATGHVFQCGPRVVEFPKDGPATLSIRDNPAILTATHTHWRTARVKLGFGPAAPPIQLAEFGTTVTLKAPDGAVPCIKVR